MESTDTAKDSFKVYKTKGHKGSASCRLFQKGRGSIFLNSKTARIVRLNEIQV